jgi:hypothetical protein
VCQSDIREQALEQLREIIATSEPNLSGIGFVHSLLILDAYV